MGLFDCNSIVWGDNIWTTDTVIVILLCATYALHEHQVAAMPNKSIETRLKQYNNFSFH